MKSKLSLLVNLSQVLRYFSRVDKLIFVASAVALIILIVALPTFKGSIFSGGTHPADLPGPSETLQHSVDFLETLGYARPDGATGYFRQIRSEYGNHIRYHFGQQALTEARQTYPWYTPPAVYSVKSLSTSHGRDNLLRMLIFNMDELNEAGTLDGDDIGLDVVRYQINIDEKGVAFEMEASGLRRFTHETINRALLEEAIGKPIPDEISRIYLQIGELVTVNATDEILVLTTDDASRLAQFVLSHTRWAGATLEIEETSTVSSNNQHTLYRIRMVSKQEVLGRTLHIDTEIDQQGYVQRIHPVWIETQGDTAKLPTTVHNRSRVIILIILGILAFFIFLYRLVRQELDLKSARNDAIITFVAIFFVSLNSSFTDALQQGFFTPGLWDLIGTVLGGVLVGAGAALLIYIFSSIASSISHEIWPERIHSLNLLRRGYLNNKPVGMSVLRALALALLVPVLPILIHAVFSRVEIMTLSDFLFLSEQYPLAFTHVLGKSVYAAQQVAFLILLLTLALLRKRVTNNFLFYGIGILILTWVDMNPATLLGYPNLAGQFVAACIVLFAFHKYGALAALLVPFFASAWWSLLSGMAIGAGPDVLQLALLGVVLAGALVLGLTASANGANATTLPDFVPTYILELANRERMSRELEIARQVQQTFLPVSNPVIEGFELYASCKPASEVGGDYYEFIQVDDHNVAVSIGDVSGKGFQAAFFMTLVKGYTQSLAESNLDPKTFLTRVNSLFYRNAPRGTFITMIYGYLDTREKTFTMARAGHNPMLVYTSATKNASYVQTSGMALGLINDGRFADNLACTSMKLKTGDCILLYTDGYTEAMNRAGEQYGDKRFQRVVERCGGLELAQLIEEIDADVHNFTGGIARHDDMTIMGIRVL